MELSIFVTDFDEKLKPLLHGSRSDCGIVVVAQVPGCTPVFTAFGPAVAGIVHKFRSSDPVVLQVERGKSLQYRAFEMV